MYTPLQVQRFNEIAHRYKAIAHRSITEVLNQYRNTGAGVASVRVEVVEGTSTKSPDINIEFDDHLIVLNKRKVEWTKLPAMKDLVAWAETKKANPQEAKQLAWAVAWDKKKNDTWKAKPWRKKSLSEVLKDMNKQILEAFDKAIEQEIVEEFNNA